MSHNHEKSVQDRLREDALYPPKIDGKAVMTQKIGRQYLRQKCFLTNI